MGGHDRIRYAKDVYWPAGGHYAHTRSGPKWFIIGMTSCFILSASVCYFSSLFERREVEALSDSPYPFLSKRWARQYREEKEGK